MNVWELVAGDETSVSDGRLDRMRVKGGWLYCRSWFRFMELENNNCRWDQVASVMAFVPDEAAD